MFMQIAIGAIGIGVVLMVGYLVIAQVRSALPDVTRSYTNPCLEGNSTCNLTSTECGLVNNNTYPEIFNTSATVTCDDPTVIAGMDATQTTVFAGFGLVAVGIIVLAAFGLITIFK